jgi:hypothetical protein
MRLCRRCPHIQLFQLIGGVAASVVLANAMPPSGVACVYLDGLARDAAQAHGIVAAIIGGDRMAVPCRFDQPLAGG